MTQDAMLGRNVQAPATTASALSSSRPPDTLGASSTSLVPTPASPRKRAAVLVSCSLRVSLKN
jgi:hypothetical protein